MKYFITLDVEVDPDAHFIEADMKNIESYMEDYFFNVVYDMDDVTLVDFSISLEG